MSFWARLYEDYFMTSRMNDYRYMLEGLQMRGVRVMSVGDFWHACTHGGSPPGPVAILRHDVDTGPTTARRMWEVNIALGIRASFYFRLCTLTPDLMREMHASGAEVSYHFEEAASYAKEMNLTHGDQIRSRINLLQERFLGNLNLFREISGAPCVTVASHGDFANRALGVMNWEILCGDEIRKRAGVSLEAYDENFVKRLDAHLSDRCGPPWWKGGDPLQHEWTRESVVQILIHPRHWKVEWRDNTRENLVRMKEGFEMRLAKRKIIK